jgi:5-formyltetrahydrofolate cyclo-ligase
MSTQIDALSPSPAWGEVRRWRKLVRNDLLQRRTALSANARRALGERACTLLAQAIDLKAYNVLGFC